MKAIHRNKSQFSRLLELDRRIREGTYPNCLTFASEWEVSQKTVQRDIDYLRDMLGAPIQYDREKKGFHYEDRTWFLPALSVSEGDLLALLVASRAAEAFRGSPLSVNLQAVFAKLQAILPDTVTVQPEFLSSRFSFVAPPAKLIDAAVWTPLVRGLVTGRKLRLKYRSFDAVRARDVLLSPYHMANLQGEWYVLGAEGGNPDVRQYSLARMSDLTLTKDPFQMPVTFDARKYIAGAFGRVLCPERLYRVRLRFAKEVVPWVMERQWHPQQKIAKARNGSVVLAFEAGGLLEVMRWVLAWGHSVEVLAPPELRRMVDEEIALMSKGRAPS